MRVVRREKKGRERRGKVGLEDRGGERENARFGITGNLSHFFGIAIFGIFRIFIYILRASGLFAGLLLSGHLLNPWILSLIIGSGLID